MELVNATGFPGRILLGPDKNGYEALTVVLKATFQVETGACVRAEEQLPLVEADLFHGDPATTSMKLHTDLAPWKPATDVVLLGHAYAPKPGATESVVRFRAGPVSQVAQVTGDRYWSLSLGIAKTHGPKPFERIPLTFEHAFGGVQRKDDSDAVEGAEPRNPVGRGFVEKRTKFVNGLKLPNLEDPRDLLKPPDQTDPGAGGVRVRGAPLAPPPQLQRHLRRRLGAKPYAASAGGLRRARTQRRAGSASGHAVLQGRRAHPRRGGASRRAASVQPARSGLPV